MDTTPAPVVHPRVPRATARPAPSTGVPQPRSRLEALFEWGRWELTVVPARRWEWMKTVMRAGDSRERGPQRRD